MKTVLCGILLILTNTCLFAQTYKDSILVFRRNYMNDFLTDEHSPLKAADTSFIRFYPVDHSYCLVAHFNASPDAKPFNILTHTGKNKSYREYGTLSFILHGSTCTLHVYQALDLIAKNPKFNNYLFIPFTDETNYTQTFGGGRYIDLSTDDIKNDKLVLDFNKCYNPYCAFAEGYSCPIPPKENALHIAIKAGEKLFGKALK